MSDDEYPTNDADLWLNLRTRLQEGMNRTAVLAASDACPVDLSGEDGSALARWSMACVKTQGPVHDTLFPYLASGQLEEHHGPYRWFLHQRFLAAWRFVRQMAFSRGHATGDPEWICPFPFPKQSGDEVLKFLLTEWWLMVGSHMAYESLRQTLPNTPASGRQ